MRGLCLLLLAAAVASAGEYDPDTLAGMDAEVREDWVRAVAAFGRADAKRVPGSMVRLRSARKRAMDFWESEIKSLVKEERYEAAALAVAIARLIKPKQSIVTRTARQLSKKGVDVPELAPGSSGETGPFPSRSPNGRGIGWGSLGAAGVRGDRVLERCLGFLVATQEEDGSWDAKEHGGSPSYDAGVTALSLMALLSEGKGGLVGERGAAARRARDQLAASQDRDGRFGDARTTHFHYNSFLATEALAEYAAIAGETEKLRSVLELARDAIVDAQNRGAGWRYEPRSGESDTCLTALAVCALSRLRLAGIDVPPEAFEGAARWIRSMTDKEYGQIGYIHPGGAGARPEGLGDVFPPEHSHAMTGAGAVAWVYCGRSQDSIRRGLLLVREKPPEARYPDFYYWHFGARALQACDSHVARDWYGALVKACEDFQKPDGGIAAKDPWSPDGGRIYATAACALALAVPHREPPIEAPLRYSASLFLDRKVRRTLLPSNLPYVTTGVYLDARTEVKVATRVLLEDRGATRPDGNPHGPSNVRLLRDAPSGCLLGRVGTDGPYFRIESGKPFTTKTPGPLYLLVNDTTDRREAFWWEVTIQLAD